MQMLRSTPNNTRHLPKWAIAFRREMQMAIGRQLSIECKVPQELPPKLTALLIQEGKEHNPYADIVGTC
jgi:hypothetical protein